MLINKNRLKLCWMIIAHGQKGEKMSDKYGYIGIETLLNFCENSKNHAITPNEFLRMQRVKMPAVQPEIIGCKECKYWRYDSDHTCRYLGGATVWPAYAHCSFAERREDR